MGAVPAWLLRHRVTIERYLGEAATGPRYAAPEVDVPAFVDSARRKVRNAAGKEVLSTTTVILAPTVADVPPQSRVTLPAPDGRRASVITASRADGGGLPTPDHLELALE